MSIKGLFGFCECKGCKHRRDFEMDIIRHFSDGSKQTQTVKICREHAMQLMKKGQLKNVMVEEDEI